MIHPEAIRAWRIWRLAHGSSLGPTEPLLESCIYGDAWLPRQVFSAECPFHPRPSLGCGCGIYAVTTREAALEWGRWAQSALPQPIVIGQVQLWGRVLPHSAGYRAEHGYPYELEVLDDGRLDERERQDLAYGLRARYLVDVVARAA
jgi:hypothetical protein